MIENFWDNLTFFIIHRELSRNLHKLLPLIYPINKLTHHWQSLHVFFRERTYEETRHLTLEIHEDISRK